jgi:hypothetical protein
MREQHAHRMRSPFRASVSWVTLAKNKRFSSQFGYHARRSPWENGYTESYQVSLIMIDGHDFPGHIDKLVPGEAAVVEDVVVGFEDAV